MVYTQLNTKMFLFQAIQFNYKYIVSISKTVPFQTIQFSIGTHFRLGPIKCYHSGPECTWERWQWRSTQDSSKLQHYWNLIIRLFSAISRTLAVGSLTSLQEAVGVFYRPSLLSKKMLWELCQRKSWSFAAE